MKPLPSDKFSRAFHEPKNGSLSLFLLRVHCAGGSRGWHATRRCGARYPRRFTHRMASAFSPQKQFSAMKTNTTDPETFEFCFPNLDTLVCVENRPDEVVVHATRATFSEERKTCFIRELAAEGFIPDSYRWFHNGSSFLCHSTVRWLVDYSWWRLNPVVIANTRRFMVRLFLGGALLWFILMASVLIGSAQHDSSGTQKPVNTTTTHG